MDDDAAAAVLSHGVDAADASPLRADAGCARCCRCRRDPVIDDYGFDRYLNVLHETDRQMSRVFEAVRRAGRQDDTLIVVTGDHGQAFGYPHESFMQGRTIYDEDVRVPLLLWLPRKYRARRGRPRSAAMSTSRRRSPISPGFRRRPTGRAAACSTHSADRAPISTSPKMNSCSACARSAGSTSST